MRYLACYFLECRVPTIKDIAKLAGVSHGTVSNVLNDRGNVSADKIKRVEIAAQQLGYQLNVQAKILKEGFANTVSIILPNITSEHYIQLYEGLYRDFTLKGYDTTLYLTDDQQELELKIIQKIAAKKDYAIITVSCLSCASSYYDMVKIPQENIIFIYRQIEQAKQFLTLDFSQAGQDIADAIMMKQYRRIGLFTNFTKNTSSQSLKTALLARFAAHQYEIELQHLESATLDNTYNLAFDFFNSKQPQLEAIITSDIERAHYIRSANYLGSQLPCPTIYALSGNNFSYEEQIQQYHMNYGMLSQQIIQLIETPQALPYLANKGFIFQEITILQTQAKNKALTFLILPSPSTDAVIKLLPHFKKVTGIDVDIIVKPFSEIYTLLNELHKYPEIDIIRVDMAGLPWFAPNTLKPLTELDIQIEQLLQHYPEQVVKRYAMVNEQHYAIPFDPSIQMLFYRQDLFNDPLVKRLYYEEYKHNLQIPTTFAEFKQISQFFTQQYNAESPIKYGSCVTLGNAEIIASEFLVRYYALGGRLINQQNIQLQTDIAIATLTDFYAFIQTTQRLSSGWWQESVKQFEEGNLAMLIVYANLFYYMAHKNISPLVGFAAVPGLHPLFGGGSLGMSKYSQKNEEVSAFFNWLFSAEISEQIALLGGSPARNNIYQNATIINNYPWINMAHENYNIGIRENHFKDGGSINLRAIENLIGQHLLDWMNHVYSHEEVIKEINQALKVIPAY